MRKTTINHKSKGDVWFIYDGDCPICQLGARGFRVKQAIGSLHLVNAREEKNHPVVQEINNEGLDLDQGMVIKFHDHYYQGADALQVMGFLGTNQGWLNRMNYLLFRSRFLSHVCYPAMKGVRNIALKIKGIEKIRNLYPPEKPIFQTIFGEAWHSLPPVMLKHYANHPFSNDSVTVEGTMEVSFGFLAKALNPLFRLLGALVPYQGKDIPVTVSFRSEPGSNAYCFDRAFHFPGKPVYHFRSRMLPQGGNEVVEYMRFGIGWRAAYAFENGKVLLRHKGYVWKLLGVKLPLPLTLVFGKGYAKEEALTEDSFAMKMEVTHPLWGRVYEYKGIFNF